MKPSKLTQPLSLMFLRWRHRSRHNLSASDLYMGFCLTQPLSLMSLRWRHRSRHNLSASGLYMGFCLLAQLRQQSSDVDFALGILCFVRLIRQGLINGNLLAAGFEVFFLLTKSYQALLRENLVLVLGSFCLLYANWITKTEYSACHFRRRAEDFAVSASFPMISPGSVERTLHLTSE